LKTPSKTELLPDSNNLLVVTR